MSKGFLGDRNAPSLENRNALQKAAILAAIAQAAVLPTVFSTAAYAEAPNSNRETITAQRTLRNTAKPEDLPTLAPPNQPVRPPQPAPILRDANITPAPGTSVPASSQPAAPYTISPNGSIPSLNPLTSPRYDQPLTGTAPTQVDPAVLPSAFDDYHLGPGDSIFVSVQRYADLSFQATLDLQGNVVVPIEGAISLQGRTLPETEALLRGIYNEYVDINSTTVDVTLVAQRGVEVTILGSVQRPGFYPLQDPSVSTALLTAGGATRTSDLRAIQIQRQFQRNGTLTEETINVDLFTPLKEGSPLPNVRLEDGDVVVIPELDPSQLDEYDRFLVARSTLAQPVINVRFLNYAGGRSGIGTLNLNNGSTFVDAVSVLGVNPDTARLGDVALIRYDPETGRAVTISLDAKEAVMGDITQNPPLEDSDVIVVGRNLIGRLSYTLQTITRPFRDVFGFTNFINDAFFDETPFQ